MAWIKSTVFILVVAMLSLPAVQKAFKIFPTTALEGYFVPSSRQVFSLASFSTGEYQQKMTPHLDRTIGFHNELTRLFNQCDFSLFSIPHAARIIVGKDNCLQADYHIDAYLGRDFIGKRFIDDKVARLKFLQDWLWKKKGIRLLVIIAPGKGFYYPEAIPGRFLKGKRGITNNDYYAQRMVENGVNLIDFNRWMVSLKDTSRNILYPKTGVHWSTYGAFLCADSLTRYLEVKLGRAVPHVVLDSLVHEPVARRSDNDMYRVLNLMCAIGGPVMTYPVFHHEYSDTLPKPSALFISDSFYWNWHDNGIIKNTFRCEEMWYYDKEVYPMQRIRHTNTALIDLDQAVSRQDVIILLETNAGYGNPGFGFIDRAYEYYYPGKTRIKQLEEGFRANPEMMDLLRKKAREQNLPLDAVMLTDAIYVYNNELKRISTHN